MSITTGRGPFQYANYLREDASGNDMPGGKKKKSIVCPSFNSMDISVVFYIHTVSVQKLKNKNK